MDFDEVDRQRQHSAAWRLLRAEHAPLILSFLGRVFVDDNIRSISGTALAEQLDDELFALNQRSGPGTYPKPAKAYLDDWARPDAGWLRKYYPPGSDEVHYDATPAVERAVAWVNALQERSFVGTESRLNVAFELLRQMAYGSESDPDLRLAELRRRRAELDAEIARVHGGNVEVLDGAAQRDRYQQFVATARGLLGDFREVEANFRALDRQMREQITAWNGAKGDLLHELVGDRQAIAHSDQGRSFDAFYDFLLANQRQQEFTDLLARVHALPAISEPDPRVRRVHYEWLDAADRTQATVRLLSEQLRSFLDDQVWFENRRVMDILHSIEAHALQLRDQPTASITTEIDALAPAVGLPMERPLYRPRTKLPLNSAHVAGEDPDLDVSLLFEQVHVDALRLTATVREVLQVRSQTTLSDIVADRPLEQGLAELVTYLSLNDPAFDVVFDEERREQVSWRDGDGAARLATVPGVTFVRALDTEVGR
ncbi:MAG: DUF3375 domain-containing protein [Sporichthyaceae bacterium]|nr:DUF3375 domain-containing protein [Sporichthyaceae bacterium]